MGNENVVSATISFELSEVSLSKIIENLIDIEIERFKKKLGATPARNHISIESFSVICGSVFKFIPKEYKSTPIHSTLEIEYSTVFTVNGGGSMEKCRYSLLSESVDEETHKKKNEIFEILYNSINSQQRSLNKM